MPQRPRSKPNPSPKNPLITKVLEPSEGHYVVTVRMTTALLKDYPDNPWGTGIDQIGLPPREIEKFPNYELVEIQSVAGSEDLYWIFQKLNGPIWTDKTLGVESLIPSKFRRLITTTKTEQEVDPATEPTTITGDLTISAIKAQKNTGKSTRIEITETIDQNASPLEGEKTDTWGINTTEELIVNEGDAVNSGFGVKGSQVVPLGNGKSIKFTENYPPDLEPDSIIYKLEAQNIDDKSGIVLDIDKELVDASVAKALSATRRGNGWFPELQPLDKWHTIMISTKPDESSIPVVPEVWNEVINISLPNRLLEAGVIWDLDSDDGAGATGINDAATIEAEEISWSVSAEAMVNGNITGRPYTKIKAGRSGSANVNVSRTYHIGPPTTTISAYVFEPVYGSLLIRGIQGSRTARGTQTGIGAIRIDNSLNYKSHYDTNLLVHDFGPIEHASPAITILGDSLVSSPVLTNTKTATTGTLPGSGFFPVATADISLTADVTLELPLSSTPLETGNTYIINVDVKEWGFGIWVREVYTVTVP